MPATMNKPQLFINIHYLEIGGAETSLIGLLQALDPDKVNIDLFINDHRGEMMQFIPEWVNVLPAVPAYTLIERPMKEVLQHGFIRLFLARLWAKWKFWRYEQKNHPKDGSAIFGYVGRYVTSVLPPIRQTKTYDLAISFVTPHNIVLHKIKAKKKICWIHTDYTKIDVNTALEYPVWDGYDHIVSISKDVTRTFCEVFPNLKDKIIEIENIIAPEFIRQRAELEPRPADMPAEKDSTILLTIGRYSYPKKLEEIPMICRLLVEKGCKVKWYIVGYGGSGGYIRKAIQEEDMQSYVIMLGKKANPYPYIKACDWYVQPSRYEGKSVVVREAQILQKPVIITDYPTASSQVKNGIDGVIVPMPVKSCAEAIGSTVNNECLKSKIVGYLAAHDYGNENEVEKLYKLISF